VLREFRTACIVTSMTRAAILAMSGLRPSTKRTRPHPAAIAALQSLRSVFTHYTPGPAACASLGVRPVGRSLLLIVLEAPEVS
jgi:hypothetical protein